MLSLIQYNQCSITGLSISSDLEKYKRGLLAKIHQMPRCLWLQRNLLPHPQLCAPNVGWCFMSDFFSQNSFLCSEHCLLTLSPHPPHSPMCPTSATICITFSQTPRCPSASLSSTITIATGKMNHTGAPTVFFYGTYK